MSQPDPVLLKLKNLFSGKGRQKGKDPYGYRYVYNAEIAAEVELCIGLVTTALIIIYRGNLWAAAGTLAGFLILEYLTLMAISMAYNIIRLRHQVESLLAAQQQGQPPIPDLEEEEEEEDPYKILRIIGISTAVTLGIVLVRTYF